MKRIILCAVITAVAMSSCSNDENVSNTGKKVLGFGTYVERATKGSNAITGISYPVNGKFLVMGYDTGTSSLTATSPLNFMRNEVTYDGTNYTCYPLHYWPDADNVSFFAIHPADDVINSTTPATVSATSTQLPSVPFIVNSDPSSQADLMMASAVDQTASISGGIVNFSFKHQLTRIGFGAKLATDYPSTGDYIRIKSIVVSNVASTATFSFGTDGKVTETTPATPANFTLNTGNLVSNGSVTSTSSFDPVNLSNSYLLMVPSDYSASTTAAITINYDVTCADGTKSSHVITKNLKELTTGNKWAVGQSITYNMTISLTAISFTANITDWTNSADSPVGLN